MKIAWISHGLPYLPSRGGFRLYGGNLIRTLSRRHEIDLVSLLLDDDAEHLDWAKPYCTSVSGIPTNGVSIPQRLTNFLSSYLRRLARRRSLRGRLGPGRAADRESAVGARFLDVAL